MFKQIAKIYRYHQVKNITQFNNLIKTIKTPYILDFYAGWCGPCKMLWPIISKVEQENTGKWTIIKIDVDEEGLSEIVQNHQISGVPTLAFYKGNQKVYQRAGFADDKAFKELVNKYLI